MSKCFHGLILGLLLLSSTSFAATCGDNLDPQEPKSLSEIEAVFKDYSDNVDQGIGMRGFMGSKIPNTPEYGEVALKHGIMWWGIRFFLVSDLQQAIDHRLKQRAFHESKATPFTDVIIAPIYIIGQESELGIDLSENGPSKTPVPSDVVKRLLTREAYEIDYLGNAKLVSTERLQERIDPETMEFNRTNHLEGYFGFNSLSQPGWVALKQHGIHDYAKWKDSGTAKGLRKLAIKLVEQGYTIRFNYDHVAALNKLKEQKRTFAVTSEDGVTKVRKTLDQAFNRYDNQKLFDMNLAKLNAGKGYSIGVYSPTGELLGGEIGFRVGNHVYGDSIFYSEGDNDVNYAKIAALALMDYLDSKGMPYTDPGMVTPYTASMGGELIPFKVYIEKMQSGPKALIEFPENWDPRGDEYYEKAFSDISRRRSQGIGNILAISQWPSRSAIADEIAKRFKVVPNVLKIRLVKSKEEASTDAATYLSLGSKAMPLYWIVPEDFTWSLGEAPLAIVRRLIELGDRAQVVQIKHPKFNDSMVPVDRKRLNDLIFPDKKSSAIEMQGQTLSLPVWTVE